VEIICCELKLNSIKQKRNIANSLFTQLAMLKRINLSGCFFTDHQVTLLAAILAKMTSLEELDISNADLSAARLKAIAEALNCTAHLQFLRMHRNNMGEEVTSDVIAVLSRHYLIQELSISFNRLPSASAIKIAFELSKFNNIKTLNICNNSITSDSIDNLAVSLANCTTLQELDLSHNLLTFNSVLKVVRELKRHPSLSALNLCNKFVYFLSESEFLVDVILSANSSLMYLNVCGRNIRPRFIDDYMSPPFNTDTSSFVLHNLYLAQYLLMNGNTAGEKLANVPDKYIKTKEKCPFTEKDNGYCLSKKDPAIDSYFVDHNGGTFYNQEHDFAIVVPPNAVSVGDCIEILAFASQFASYEQYEIPDEYRPISSFFWASADYTFKIPVYLIMSHYAKFKSLED